MTDPAGTGRAERGEGDRHARATGGCRSTARRTTSRVSPTARRRRAADGYLRDLKNMGVNTIRTWGVDDTGTPTLLDSAAQQGIKVIVGHWLNQGADYVNDTAYMDATLTEIVNRVNALKNNPGVLLWDVGNEVILTMQDHGLSAADVRGAAHRLRQVRQPGGRRDPRGRPEPPGHLDRRLDRRLAVLQAVRAGTWTCWRSTPTARSATSSRTGSTAATPSRTSSPRAARPASGRSRTTSTGCRPSRPICRSGTGTRPAGTRIAVAPGRGPRRAPSSTTALENDFGGVWLNTFTGGWKRLGYYALTEGLHRADAGRTPRPQITGMTVGDQTAVPAGGTFTVTVDGHRSRRRPDPLQPDGQRQVHHRRHRTEQRDLHRRRATGRSPSRRRQTLGVWKVYVYAFDGQGNVGIEHEVVQGGAADRSRVPTSPSASTATASSYQPTGTNGPQLPRLRGRRRLRHPLGHASGCDTAVAPGRPRLGAVVQPRAARLGGGVRHVATRSRPRTTARTGRPSTRPPPATAASTTWR